MAHIDLMHSLGAGTTFLKPGIITSGMGSIGGRWAEIWDMIVGAGMLSGWWLCGHLLLLCHIYGANFL